jgi:hypothetical protein
VERKSVPNKKSPFIESFVSIQNHTDIFGFLLWILAFVVAFCFRYEKMLSWFDICSIVLLVLSIFNLISMIGLSLWIKERFAIWRCIVRACMTLIAIAGLVLNQFLIGLQVH